MENIKIYNPQKAITPTIDDLKRQIDKMQAEDDAEIWDDVLAIANDAVERGVVCSDEFLSQVKRMFTIARKNDTELG